MTKVVFCLLLLLFTKAMPQSGNCGPGGITCPSGACKFPYYIEGCLEYSSAKACSQCEYNYVKKGRICEYSPSTNLTDCCQDYDQTGKCLQCPPGLVLDNGNCKEVKIVGCLIKSVTGNCTNCASAYVLSKGVCVKKIIGCDRYVASGDCAVCISGFQRVNGTCIPDPIASSECTLPFSRDSQGQCLIEGCEIFNDFGCARCLPEYTLLPEGGCAYGQIEGCQKYQRDGMCEICLSPLFRQLNGRCLIGGCLSTDETGKCNSCEGSSGFVLDSDGVCRIAHCLVHDSQQCLLCDTGYVETARGCQPDSPVKVCAVCASNQAQSEDGSCIPKDPYCRTYSAEGKCTSCKPGYIHTETYCFQQKIGCSYIDGRCASCLSPFEYDPEAQSCRIDGCLQYFAGGCTECDADLGYTLMYNDCKLSNCLNAVQGICRECDPNYIKRTDGKCIKRDEFCLQYGSDGFCLQCVANYYMSMTKICLLKEPGCIYDEKDTCSECESPFVFDGTRCDISGCIQVTHNGCQSCQYPMTKTEDGSCQVPFCDLMGKNRCARCQIGYQAAEDGSCKEQDSNCLVYESQRCQKCIKGYKLDSKRVCQYSDQHCWEFTVQGKCSNCDRHYFLNPQHQCQSKDPNCGAYSGGRCIQCKHYFYLQQGICYPNSQGCQVQINWGECEKCEQGQKLELGKCTPVITQLNWDSVHMDFWTGGVSQDGQNSHDVFSIGKTNKYNLDPAIAQGQATVIYSSNKNAVMAFQVDDYSSQLGWEVTGSPKGQYLGVELNSMQTFYAVDIRTLEGNTMTSFSIEQSDDGVSFTRLQEFMLKGKAIGVVETFYFTPVYSKVMRVVVENGRPSIKFEFYYSNGEDNGTEQELSSPQSQVSSLISQKFEEAVQLKIRGEIFKAADSCSDQQLCWMGLELCEAQEVQGFTLIARDDSDGEIQTIQIRYSADGVKFECYSDCEEVELTNKSYILNPAVVATKLRIYPKQWSGTPSYTVIFNY